MVAIIAQYLCHSPHLKCTLTVKVCRLDAGRVYGHIPSFFMRCYFGVIKNCLRRFPHQIFDPYSSAVAVSPFDVCLRPKLHPIPYIVHYFLPGPIRIGCHLGHTHSLRWNGCFSFVCLSGVWLAETDHVCTYLFSTLSLLNKSTVDVQYLRAICWLAALHFETFIPQRFQKSTA